MYKLFERNADLLDTAAIVLGVPAMIVVVVAFLGPSLHNLWLWVTGRGDERRVPQGPDTDWDGAP